MLDSLYNIHTSMNPASTSCFSVGFCINGEIICCQLELGDIAKLFSELKLITDNLLFICDDINVAYFT